MFAQSARFGSTRFAQFAGVLFMAFAVAGPASSQAHPSAGLTVVASGTPGAAGTITIAFNGFSESVSYGQFSTPGSIASAFASKFSQDPISALPGLCTQGICAKADGAQIVFQLVQAGATFGALNVTSPNNPFSINASAWPAAGVTQIGVFCDPSEIAVGTATECTASLPAGTAGTVVFTVDSGTQLTATIDSGGDATISNVLQGGAAGIHSVTATYTPSGAASVSGIAVVTINPVAAAAAPAGPVYSYNISSYAPNGNILAYSDSVTGTWSSIGYDSLNRLSLSTQTPQPVDGVAQPTKYTCWNYDSFGNRLNQISSSQAFPSGSGGPGACTPNGSNYSVNSMQYDAANQITYGQWGGQVGGALAYDGSGNMTSDLTNAYLYDPEGHVCAILGPTIAGIPGRITGYLYNDAGQRVAKGTLATMSCDPTLVVNGQPNFTATNIYVLGSGGEQMTELTPNSSGVMQWKHTNVYAAGTLVATYDVTSSTTQPLHFQIADWLGSRRVQTDYAGNVEENCISLPFGDAPSVGNLPDCTQTAVATADDSTEQHFTGKERDTESGNDYFGARYYASSMGRFMSPDWPLKIEPVPFADLSDPQTLNLYSYAHNNPLSRSDPDGHCTVDGETHGGLWCFAHAIGLTETQHEQANNARAELAQMHNLIFAGQKPQDVAKNTNDKAVLGYDRQLTLYLAQVAFLGQTPGNSIGIAAAIGPGFAGLKTATPVGSALKDNDLSHQAAVWMRDQAAEGGQVFRITGGDGVQRTLIQIPGEVNGAAGRFEYIVDDAGQLTHERWIQGGTINGMPNKP